MLALIQRVVAGRAALRVDANQGYTAAEAVDVDRTASIRPASSSSSSRARPATGTRIAWRSTRRRAPAFR